MAVFYVKKNASGNDVFCTIETARDAVRLLIAEGLTEPVTVIVEAGEYRTSGLVFDAHDSGTADCPVTYCADGEVILNGGMSLDPADFKPLTDAERARLHGDAPEKVVRIDLTKLGLTSADWGKLCAIGSYNTASKYDGAVTSPMWCELFVNDRRMEIARYPDTGYLNTVDVVREGKCLEPTGKARMDPGEWAMLRNPLGDIRTIDPDTAKRAAGWKSLDGVWCFGYPKYGWADMATPIDRIDPDTCEMETHYVSMYGIREHAPYYFFNVFEELDAPGEWFLDRKTGMLYLYPDCDLASAEINLSLLKDNLIRFNNTSYVTLRGFTFTGTRNDALDLTGDGITVENCVVKNVAGNAILVKGENCRVDGCEIHHTGRGGVQMTGGDRVTLTPSGNIVTNNHIHHIAEIFRTYQPAVQIVGVGAVCSHNCIHDSAHMAIGFSGNEHVMEYNEIYEVCQIADDSSAIYSGRDYTVCGNVVRCNFFHDMKSDADNHIGIFGMYCDDNLGSCTIEKNVFLRCQSALLLHGGHDMVFANNLIIDACPKSQYSLRFHKYGYWDTLLPGGTHDERLKAVPWQGELWSEKYPHIADYLTWDPETEQCIPHYCRIANNIIINHKPVDVRGFDCHEERLHNVVENNIEVNVDDIHTLTNDKLREILPQFEEIPFDEIGLKK
ncbi:MAG: right-handed parallel beta-helix repeat-containing protein [Clostridia bacterium]|nr:right-handed parallel beta-helix repeat-containing protein [Clostridia bacterium]